MLNRRFTVILPLLYALLFCVLATQSASAVEAKNTTAFTCVPKAKGDFKDAHCDETSLGTGEFGHAAIPLNETTEVSLTNEKTAEKTTKSTPAVLKGTLLGNTLEIECSTANGKGTFKNEEPEPNVHTGKGTGTTEMSECKVLKPTNCTVKNITVEVTGVPVEGLGAGKNEMGGEVKPGPSGAFASFTLEGAKCSLKGLLFQVVGSAIATGTPLASGKSTGATARYSPENEMEKLEIKGSGKPAEFRLTTTVRAVAKGGELIPLSGTTTT